MADLMSISFFVFAVSVVLGSIAVVRRSRKQVRLFFGIALVCVLLIIVSLVALASSGGV
ncbi:hypothetical protein QWJ34_23890 [Saccharibacillus sp. CPCC 101409]|uniref:hypothetical protein n=1 Tax=Saccharibacillus sp. CPCC 101409 TaxID=3058041 RepID=UPI0026735F86|nr:hypothetical protein [Saccharibacillus sp. CPCC 101409]MDO3412829.1 hypothetical protein [Saccharibacillus sp. CPCC 101409]